MNSTITSANGLQRFNYFLQQLQAILDKAALSDNPALFIYQQNARTPIFMLEGLSRLYKNIHNKKIFTKLNTRFKELEDLLGAVDYYDGFYKEFTEKKNMPESILDFLKKQKKDKLIALDKQLTDGGWTGQDNKRMQKIAAKLAKADWLNEEDDDAAIVNCYKKDIGSIVKNVQENKIGFTDVEKDVHELRRELRWLSIYPQALRGLMQLSPATGSPDFLKKYLTNEIITSPYNKMPDDSSLQKHILLNTGYFYALSWLIAELGKLKDNGLRLLVLKEALKSLNKMSDAEAEQQALKLSGEGQMTLYEILVQSKKISVQFFAEEIIEHLLID